MLRRLGYEVAFLSVTGLTLVFDGVSICVKLIKTVEVAPIISNKSDVPYTDEDLRKGEAPKERFIRRIGSWAYDQ